MATFPVNLVPGDPTYATAPLSRPVQAPNGALYCTSYGGTFPLSTNAHVFKSTDGGLTWTEKDAANAPNLGLPMVAACLVGTLIVAVGPVESIVFPFPFHYATANFDTATDTWGVIFTSAIVALEDPSGIHNLFVVARPVDGKVILTVSNHQVIAGTSYARVSYAVIDPLAPSISAFSPCGSTWGIAEHEQPSQPALGNGMVHIVGQRSDSYFAPSTFATLWQQPLSDAGVFGAVQTLKTSAATNGLPLVSFADAFGDGTNLIFTWVPDTASGYSTDFQVFTGASAAVIAPLVETDLSNAGAAPFTTQALSCIISNGKNLVLVSVYDGATEALDQLQISEDLAAPVLVGPWLGMGFPFIAGPLPLMPGLQWGIACHTDSGAPGGDQFFGSEVSAPAAAALFKYIQPQRYIPLTHLQFCCTMCVPAASNTSSEFKNQL